MISNTTGNKTHYIIIPYSTLSNIGSHQVVYRTSQYQQKKKRNQNKLKALYYLDIKKKVPSTKRLQFKWLNTLKREERQNA